MPYQSNELLFSHFRDNNIDLSNIDAQLQLVAPDSPNLPLYRDMMLTILRMAHDDSDRWSAKITLQALRELDQSFRTLQRYKGRRKVTVFGSARTPLEHPMYALARELGASLARSDLMVITGTKCSRITPLLGEAFLISAITAGCLRLACSISALAKPRGASAVLARRSSSARLTRALRSATSWNLRAMILSSTVGTLMLRSPP